LFMPARWYFPSTPRWAEAPVVTKKDIVKAISEQIGMTQLKTKEIVQKTFDAIIDTLVREKRIELRNFGVFEVKKRAARKARNPRTGTRVDVPEKYVVTFKPGKEMEERVRQLERREAAAAAAAAESQANSAASPMPAPQTPPPQQFPAPASGPTPAPPSSDSPSHGM
jgi:nucleoid DNA-binding protein